jgi:hypothetical protein
MAKALELTYSAEINKHAWEAVIKLKLKAEEIKEWTSPVAIATYLGTIGTYLAYRNDLDALAISFLAILVPEICEVQALHANRC